MTSERRHRSRSGLNPVIALSIAYDREHLLARGLGAEHLSEMLVGIARPLLRSGASLAYAGSWDPSTPGRPNFTYELLNLISAEQEDNSIGGPDSGRSIGRLYNHLAWPGYLKVSVGTEAKWINACRIVRITQEDAGFSGDEIVADRDAESGSDRAAFNAAVTLGAMRRAVVAGQRLTWPDVPEGEVVPPTSGHVLLGGKLTGYSGFAPGLFEETLLAIREKRPTYLLGGFGGAAGVLADALLSGRVAPELTADWHREHGGDKARRLFQIAPGLRHPGADGQAGALFDALKRLIEDAAASRRLSELLRTGLSEQDTHDLLTTRTVARAIRLVRKGLESHGILRQLPA